MAKRHRAWVGAKKVGNVHNRRPRLCLVIARYCLLNSFDLDLVDNDDDSPRRSKEQAKQVKPERRRELAIHPEAQETSGGESRNQKFVCSSLGTQNRFRSTRRGVDFTPILQRSPQKSAQTTKRRIASPLNSGRDAIHGQ